jgi:hypothetical protein
MKNAIAFPHPIPTLGEQAEAVLTHPEEERDE